MRYLITPVTVTTTHGDVYLPWATSATVSRKGELRIYDGLRHRAYYAPGEWTKYAVAAPVEHAPAGEQLLVSGT